MQTPPLLSPDPNLEPMLLDCASEPAGEHALYSPNAVCLATLLGSPLAGTTLMALNYRRLGKPKSAAQTMILGVLATAVLMVVGFVLPNDFPRFLVTIVPIYGLRQLARGYQGEDFERHKVAGGRVASLWKATGIGLLGMVVVLGVLAAIVFSTDLGNPAAAGKQLAVGRSNIMYSGSATQADAQALSKALIAAGYFGPNSAASVQLTKDASGTTLGFVVNESAGDEQSAADAYAQLAELVAPSIGGKPITLKLLSPRLKELKSKKIE